MGGEVLAMHGQAVALQAGEMRDDEAAIHRTARPELAAAPRLGSSSRHL